MSAVLELPSDPERESPPGESRPALTLAASAPEASDTPPPAAASPYPTATGLKPIDRMISDTRLERIIPNSDASTLLEYSSQFARTFIRSDYNFCAAKVTVARSGKVRALDRAFRETDEWLTKAIAWIEKHNARPLVLPHEVIELKITHPLAGRLVRCLTQYDRLFVRTIEALLSQKIQPEDRENILANAEKRIRHIVFVCLPDNDQYDADGSRRDR
ncbi:AcaB family transcriptional regulator [Paraburkholderia rhizosphaerae]|uniref:Uncharacterized protein DUF1845 n=1 Tax=Paraburkholderia rhizosphaerae TaxID=480658 RepID=A0A4R8LQF0_9BURK|nr:AcaB family transcriptional regulator [Paraburkholderia rhizosphaerae]TDY48090.1 uncharacterized protein DUF1845 [Paraburkholderia rhizosphaerae]